MSNGVEPWYQERPKSQAVYNVLDFLIQHPEEGLACVGKDLRAHYLFERIGGIRIPVENGARVIFFDRGELAANHRGSVIFEVPPEGMGHPTDEQLQLFILSKYPYWRPSSPK
jgi:hypothetical protein